MIRPLGALQSVLAFGYLSGLGAQSWRGCSCFVEVQQCAEERLLCCSCGLLEVQLLHEERLLCCSCVVVLPCAVQLEASD